MTDSSDSLYSRSHYYRKFDAENLMFNANLQEFSQQVSYISALQTNGKLSPETAYERIHQCWKKLKQSQKQLGIGQPFPREDGSFDA